tara:strand:- start:5795 stop:6586 length:792 start_codon:yes stop_codon:yes gene_type:complete
LPKSKHRKRKKQNYPSRPKSQATEFTGFMGWMQNNQKWFYLGGILFLVLSLGASIIFSLVPDPAPILPPEESVEQSVEKKNELVEDTEKDTTKKIIRRYNAEPEMMIDVNKKYQATIETVKGNIVIDLFAKESPGYVNNFVFLARNNFYDGLTFHRVLADFVIQGGDPTGTGAGGPGYSLTRELNDIPLDAGIIAMAQSSTVSGSQFFIALSDVNFLKQQGFSAFGKVVGGSEVLSQIRLRNPDIVPRSAPAERIIGVTISEQ